MCASGPTVLYRLVDGRWVGEVRELNLEELAIVSREVGQCISSQAVVQVSSSGTDAHVRLFNTRELVGIPGGVIDVGQWSAFEGADREQLFLNFVRDLHTLVSIEDGSEGLMCIVHQRPDDDVIMHQKIPAA